MKKIFLIFILSYCSLILAMNTFEIEDSLLEKLVNHDNFLDYIKNTYSEDKLAKIKNKLIEKYESELVKITKKGLESYFLDNKGVMPRFCYKDPLSLTINFLALTPDQKYAVAYTSHDRLELWDMRFNHGPKDPFDSPKWRRLLAGNKNIDLISLSPCGKYLAYSYAYANTSYQFFDLLDISDPNRDEIVCESNTIGKISKIVLSKDCKLCIISCESTGISIFPINLDIGDKNIAGRAPLEFTDAKKFALSKCERFMIVCTNRHLEIWDIREYPEIKRRKIIEFDSALEAAVKFIEISTDGKYFATFTDKKISFWTIKDFDKINFEEREVTYFERLCQPRAASDNIKANINKSSVGALQSEYKLAKPITRASLKSDYIVLHSEHSYLGCDIMDVIIDINNGLFYDFKESIILSEDNDTLVCYEGDKFQVYDLSKCWIFEKLSLYQLILLIKIIKENNVQKLLNYSQNVKLYFNEKLQKYIERYLSHKIVNTLNIDSPAKKCANCKRNNCKWQCGKCKEIYYCSRNCQKAHYDEHKTICKIKK